MGSSSDIHRYYTARVRLAFALISALMIACGLFLTMALLVRGQKPPTAVREPQTVTLLERMPPTARPKSGEDKFGVPETATGIRHPAGRPLVSASILPRSLPASALAYVAKVPSVARRGLTLPVGAGLSQSVTASTRKFLGLDGRGHEHHAWVAGAGGLFYLPDGGTRAHQVKYTCPGLSVRARRKLAHHVSVMATVYALVNRHGRVVSVRFHGPAGTSGASLRNTMENGWRFRPLIINGKATAFRLRFISMTEPNMDGVIAYHCVWDRFNRAMRGSLTPTWVVSVPEQGLPIAYAYIAPQYLGDAAGGLASADNE